MALLFKTEANNENPSEYECLLETGASGLFQNQRKFLKETKFFPYKTLMIFSNNFHLSRKRIILLKESQRLSTNMIVKKMKKKQF